MRLATSEQLIQFQGLGAAFERWLRPAVGFSHPCDVLKDPHLDLPDKRAIPSSWASDASAVLDKPKLRWLLGTEEPVPLDDILEALARLDTWEAATGSVEAHQAGDALRSTGAMAATVRLAHNGLGNHAGVSPRRALAPGLKGNPQIVQSDKKFPSSRSSALETRSWPSK